MATNTGEKTVWNYEMKITMMNLHRHRAAVVVLPQPKKAVYSFQAW